MSKISRFSAFVLLTFCALSILSAAEAGQVDFNIRFFDRRIYYVESNPIYVQITITNNSPSVYRFKLADDRAFSIDFDIRTMSNRQLPHSDSLTRKRTVNSRVFFREIAIESGESFSFTEDLRDYISFNQSGSFRVRARMYPELFRVNNVSALESNFLNLNLRPELMEGPDGIPIEMDIATGAVLVKQRIPPDEVVSYMLTARQESQWERFFLYLDIEAMLQRDPVQRRRFNSENETGRRRMINDYRRIMQSANYDGDIAVIPTTFEILRTQYTNDTGTVIVLQRFRNPNFTELRQYTYDLVKRDNFWIIVNYAVQGMGTVAND
jgi:hypothetical protein